MGKSDLVKQQENNAAFQTYVKGQQTAMESYLSAAQEEVKEMVKSHYAPYPDRTLLLSGKYSDLATVSEWDTKKLSAMVNNIAGSLFGGNAPAGTNKPKQEPQVNTALLALTNQELLIATAAFSLITGILESLGASLTTKITRETKNKQVSPGIMLFVSVIENSFKDTGYFNNESIIENVYVYEVHFSEKELLAVGHLADMAAYEDEKATIRKQIENIDRALGNLSVGSTDAEVDMYIKMTTKFNTILDGLNKRLEEMMKKYATGKGAATGKMAAAPATAPAAMPSAALPRGPEAIPYLQQKAAAILAAHA